MMQTDPRMAKVVNGSPKIVFSRRLASVEDEPNRQNVRFFRAGRGWTDPPRRVQIGRAAGSAPGHVGPPDTLSPGG